MNGTKMSCPTKPYATFWEYIRDVAIAFLILIAGFLVAGAIAEPFRGLTDLAYPVALCVALAPLWWFTRRCRIHDLDFCDYAALSMFMLTVALFRSLALIGPNQRMIEACIIAVAFGGCLSSWAWIRGKARLSSRKPNQSDRT